MVLLLRLAAVRARDIRQENDATIWCEVAVRCDISAPKASMKISDVAGSQSSVRVAMSGPLAGK